jgi:hypothetical protein
MQALKTLKAQFQSYVYKHVLSIIIGLMLVKGVKTSSALAVEESVATLSRTLNERV